ncbi:MAG TPA: hypothetical protein VNB29_02960 [Chthoniobacterales bacterium]|nr:hypothetical protein [Chthoniobacterales bacterium]
MTAYLQDLNRTLAEAPDKARGLLQKHLGPIRLVPKTEGPDRHYLATGALDLSVFDRTSCGGALSDLSKTASATFPFTAKIAIDRRAA